MATAVAASARSALAGSSASHSSSSVCVTLHYLGPPGTYSHQVALALAPRLRLKNGNSRRHEGEEVRSSSSSSRGHDGAAALDVRLQPCDTIRDTVRKAREASLKRKHDTFLALLPYENNSNGPVVDSYEIVHTVCDGESVRIVGEAYLPVSHSLLVTRETEQRLRAGKLKVEESDLRKLKRISSHVQALGQCSRFIKQHLQRDTVLRETTSTGEAARLLVSAQRSNGHTEEADGAGDREDDVAFVELEACIASNVCARTDVYGLVELFHDIQNSHGNTTRFLLCQSMSADADVGEGEARSAAQIVVDPIDSTRLPPRARALYCVNIQDNSSTLLTACLAKLVSAEELDITIKKIDRQALRVEESAVQDGTSGEGAWASSYVIEVEAEQREKGDNETDFVDEARKRCKTGFGLMSNQAHHVASELQHMSSRMQEGGSSASPSGQVSCLGSWIV